MPTQPSPPLPDFATAGEAASYDRWFRAKVEKAMNSTKPSVPHEEAMERVRAAIKASRQQCSD